MITGYLKENLKPYEMKDNNYSFLKDTIWIDLYRPTKKEEAIVEQAIGLEIPTREEMLEIELSSRLYKNKDALFMTAAMIAYSESSDPQIDAVTFVLTSEKLLTIRYMKPQAFKLFTLQLQKTSELTDRPTELFIQLLEATVDRLADILETVGHRLEDYSKLIFRPEENVNESPDYQLLIQGIGNNADLNTKTRESLLSFSRILSFFTQSAKENLDNEELTRLATLSKDVGSLSDHSSFISSKVNFLLDATLGMINIEQNAIIKIFSVAAVIFLPPTLIASIYGMNFKFMPELSYKWGYLVALSLMLLSAYLPYKFFKRKKWL